MVRAGYYRSGAPGSNPVQIFTLLFSFFLSVSRITIIVNMVANKILQFCCRDHVEPLRGTYRSPVGHGIA